jgi:hypothetical protein
MRNVPNSADTEPAPCATYAIDALGETPMPAYAR